MKVTSTKTISFPSHNWGIERGEVRDLPEDKDAQKEILAHDAISEVKSGPGAPDAPAPRGGASEIKKDEVKEN